MLMDREVGILGLSQVVLQVVKMFRLCDLLIMRIARGAIIYKYKREWTIVQSVLSIFI